MKNLIMIVICGALIGVSSCQKCYECQQYCAYCVPASDTGVVYKFCASKDVTHYKIDSIYNAMQAAGFRCNKLDNLERVCDPKNKINTSLDYFLLQDYYCYPE